MTLWFCGRLCRRPREKLKLEFDLSSLFNLTIYFRSDQILFSILLLAIEPAELKKIQNNYLF